VALSWQLRHGEALRTSSLLGREAQQACDPRQLRVPGRLEDLLAVSDEQRPRPVELAAELAVVESSDHGLARTRGGDHQDRRCGWVSPAA
jgi:hypothetical protein